MKSNYNGYFGGFNNEFFDDSDMSKFYGGIFMNPEPHRPLTEAEKLEAKNIVKKTHFAAALYLAVCYITLFALSMLFKGPLASLGDAWSKDETLYALLNHFLNAIPQYLVAFPITLLFLKSVRATKRKEKTKMSIKELFTMLCIAEFLMIVGSLIGTSINMTIETITGASMDNAVSDMIENTPIWILTIFVVILAPIFEEFVFRKLLMDRLLVLGDKIAILLSALAFGAFHGNLDQFFYATLVGLVFGYVYAKTRDIKYSIILHAIINFLGSVLVIPVMEAYEKLYEFLEKFEENPGIDMTPYGVPMLITSVYSLLQYALIGFGIYSLIKLVKFKRIYILRGEITLEKGTYKDVIFKNAGVIIFYVLCTVIMLLNLIPTELEPEVAPNGAEVVYALLRAII